MAVRVRGDCPKCLQPVETDAPRNRVTWRGKCPNTAGCDGVVLARRIKGPPAAGDQPPAGDEHQDDKPATPARPRRSTIPKVTYDHQPAADSAPRVPPAPPRPARRAAGQQPDVEPRPAGEQPGAPAAEQPGRRPAAADRVESGATGRRPYAHLGY